MPAVSLSLLLLLLFSYHGHGFILAYFRLTVTEKEVFPLRLSLVAALQCVQRHTCGHGHKIKLPLQLITIMRRFSLYKLTMLNTMGNLLIVNNVFVAV